VPTHEIPLLFIPDSGRLSLQLSRPMAMLGHRIDKRGCNRVPITLMTDDKTRILCVPITFMIGSVSSEACRAQDPALCAGGRDRLAMFVCLFHKFNGIGLLLESLNALIPPGDVHGIEED
jgi:hypothetical protein